ncbi:MAG: SEC-C metal-binding domain-containing protein [Sphingobacterium sp.]
MLLKPKKYSPSNQIGMRGEKNKMTKHSQQSDTITEEALMEEKISGRCEYCGSVSYKTNGKSENICYNKANYGDCKGLVPRTVEPKTGRNQLCPCGSGIKYKKCCHG